VQLALAKCYKTLKQYSLELPLRKDALKHTGGANEWAALAQCKMQNKLFKEASISYQNAIKKIPLKLICIGSMASILRHLVTTRMPRRSLAWLSIWFLPSTLKTFPAIIISINVALIATTNWDALRLLCKIDGARKIGKNQFST
jgi:hypothetical protein